MLRGTLVRYITLAVFSSLFFPEGNLKEHLSTLQIEIHLVSKKAKSSFVIQNLTCNLVLLSPTPARTDATAGLFMLRFAPRFKSSVVKGVPQPRNLQSLPG